MGRQQAYKFNSEVKQYYLINDFTGGINTSSVDERTADNEFRQLLNVELATQGMLQNRKGWGDAGLLNDLLTHHLITLPNGPYALVKVVKNEGNLLQLLEDYEERGLTLQQFLADPLGYTFEALLIYKDNSNIKIKVLVLTNLVNGSGLFPVKDTANANFENLFTDVSLSPNLPLTNIETIEYTDFLYFALSQITNIAAGFGRYNIVTKEYARVSSAGGEFYRPTPYEVSKVGFNVLAPNPLTDIDSQNTITSLLGMYLTEYAIDDTVVPPQVVDTETPLLHIPKSGLFTVNILFGGTPTIDKFQLQFFRPRTIVVNGVPQIEEVPIQFEEKAKTREGGLMKFAVQLTLDANTEIYIRARIVTAFTPEQVTPSRTFLTFNSGSGDTNLVTYFNPAIPMGETAVRFGVLQTNGFYKIFNRGSGYNYAVATQFLNGLSTDLYNEDTISQYISMSWVAQPGDLTTYNIAINSGAFQSTSYPDTTAGNAAYNAYTEANLPNPSSYPANNWAMVFVRDANNQPIVGKLRIWKTVLTSSITTFPVLSYSPTTREIFSRSSAGATRSKVGETVGNVNNISARIPNTIDIYLAGASGVAGNYYKYNGGTANNSTDFVNFDFSEFDDSLDYTDIYTLTENEETKRVETLNTAGFRMIEISSRMVIYKSNIIWFSDLYQFDYIPNYNYVVLPLNPDDNITSIHYFKGSYMIFTKERIYKMSGTFGTGDFQIQLVSDAIGCIAPFSIRGFNNTLVFLTFDGLYRIKQNYYSGGLENVEKIDKQLGRFTFPIVDVYSAVYNEQYFLFYYYRNPADYEKAEFNVLKMYYNMVAPQGNPFVKDKYAIQPGFITRFESGMYTITNNRFYKYDKGYTDLLPPTPTDEQKVKSTFETQVVTSNLFFFYPTHDKKFKSVIIKTNADEVVPLYFNIYVDNKLVYQHTDFRAVRQPDGSLLYEAFDFANLTIGNPGLIGDYDLGIDKLGDYSTQVHKIVIAGKGKTIKVDLAQRADKYFGIQDIGYVYKMGKAREDR